MIDKNIVDKALSFYKQENKTEEECCFDMRHYLHNERINGNITAIEQTLIMYFIEEYHKNFIGD